MDLLEKTKSSVKGLMMSLEEKEKNALEEKKMQESFKSKDKGAIKKNTAAASAPGKKLVPPQPADKEGDEAVESPSSSPSPSSPPEETSAPVANGDVVAPAPQVEEPAPQDDMVSVRIAWTADYPVREKIFVTGSFCEWAENVPLENDGTAYAASIKMPKGKHTYKFIVDDEWMFDLSQPHESDEYGNYNNTIVVGE